ncbi:MAG: bifunctional hydroxymethylpyrimidine kinase/phosphomethylpyrimidine kinase [Nitrospinae bacterium]|nr:bifunctional hydroxymethylpyrimidine kinase/phosphomethylpyrimidine kinase [Nitrospinota bacterium]
MQLKIAKTVLTVAGSDSSGGAGIQADLKTFAAFGTFGTSVVASVTSQNSFGVNSAFDLPATVVEDQLRALFADRKPSAVKTGMLGNEAIVERVAGCLARHKVKKLVVDPVARSSSGKTLLSKKGVQALKEKLLPLALLTTPNLREAEILSGVRIVRPADRTKAARAILKTGVKSVLIKGGHAKGKPDDFFFDGREILLFEGERLTAEDLHGTGCVLSAAIAAGLALGCDLVSAVRRAKEFIGQSIAGGVLTGGGVPSVEPLARLYKDAERWELYKRVSTAAETLKANRIGDLIPEVQSNLVAALDGARGHEDVIGFPGRLVRNGADVAIIAPPCFGASRHVANIVLTAMQFDPSRRAVMNIKYDDRLLAICKRMKLKIAAFDRADEPKGVKVKEGSSLEWGTAKAIRDRGYVPDIVYDKGGMGKEEMIRVIAEDVETLVDRILRIHRLYSRNVW